MKVLIADDQPLDRAVLKMSLEKWGYEVVEAADGAEAMAILSTDDSPCMAVLDWMMPGLSGPEICQSVRHQERQRYVYIVLLTSKDDKEDLVRGMSAGADDYVVKPVDMHELQVRLRAGRRIVELQDELIATREELRIQATRDFLTGVWNRSMIMQRLKEELHRGTRQSTPVALLMCDIDHFKQVNDTYGHPAGDAVLVEVARRVQETLRPYDSLGRFGGEEFMILCPMTNASGGTSLAQRLREIVSAAPVTTGGVSIEVTMSIGVATHMPDRAVGVDQLISEVDAMLYAAKRNGRNRVETANAPVEV